MLGNWNAINRRWVCNERIKIEGLTSTVHDEIGDRLQYFDCLGNEQGIEKQFTHPIVEIILDIVWVVGALHFLKKPAQKYLGQVDLPGFG